MLGPFALDGSLYGEDGMSRLLKEEKSEPVRHRGERAGTRHVTGP